MHHTGQVYRPPSESDTPLLEVTSGCSWNRCSFCNMYNRTLFKVSDMKSIKEDLEELKLHHPNYLDRIFLINGDAFTLDTDKLLEITDMILEYFPDIKTISCYASILNIRNKSQEDINKLAENRINDLYIGIESANNNVLQLMNKGYSSQDVYNSLEKLQMAGIRYNALIMLGAGGKKYSKKHLEDTIQLLNTYPAYIVAVLSTKVMKDTPLMDLVRSEEFTQLTEREMINEELEILEGLDYDDDSYFLGNHIFNTVEATGYFRHKSFIKEYILEEVERLEKERPGFLDSTFNTYPKKRGGFLFL